MDGSLRYGPGDKIGGRYLVHRALQGGMGEVYLCLDLTHSSPLALKTFQSRYLQPLRLLNSFKQELENWVALGAHPNIVRCHYREMVDNQPFMFLEWVTNDLPYGSDLRSLIDRGPADPRLALDLIIDVCRGLEHAGRQRPGIVHRDLKPDNVLIGQGGVAKITDFGMAKVIGDAGVIAPGGSPAGLRSFMSGGRGVVGTPGYMAPEQWLGTEQDGRTDIYAVGCILYEIFAGRPTFHALDVDEYRDLHLATAIPSLPDDERLHRELNPLLERCLAKQREDRFETVSELLRELSSVYESCFSAVPREVAAGQGFTGADYTNRGVTYCDLKLFGLALRDHNTAVESSPEEGRFYNNRGITYDELKQYDLAVADFTRAAQLDPGNFRAFYNRGNSYVKLKQYEKAAADFDRAIRLAPSYALAYTSRGLAHLELGRLDEALRDQHLAIEIDPTLVPAYTNRGLTYVKLNQRREAEEDFTYAMRLDPSEPDAYINLGALRAQHKRLPEAWELFEEAAKLGHPQGIALAERARREFFSS